MQLILTVSLTAGAVVRGPTPVSLSLTTQYGVQSLGASTIDLPVKITCDGLP
jgi:hypothetical protein